MSCIRRSVCTSWFCFFPNSLVMGTAEEAAADDILVSAQPRIMCWARAGSSSTELVDTATAQRCQREEDATRVGLQFPFRPERRGRGAPSVAVKWRDTVKSAIMHGPLPPGDVTLDVPYWWQPGMPFVATSGLRGASAAEAQTRHVCCAEDRSREASIHARTRRSEAVVRGLPRLSCLCPWQHVLLQHSPGSAAGAGALGAAAPDTVRGWHDSGAPNVDTGGRPSMELPPFALSRLANLTHAVAAMLSLGVPSLQHVYRRVLRELDIELVPSSQWTWKFLRSLQLSWKLAATCTRHRPSEADIARERNLLQLRVIYLCDRFGISQDHIWNPDETAVRMVPAGERGWTKRAESTHVFAPSSRSHSLQT